MATTWESLKQRWGLNPELPLTDPDSAGDTETADGISAFQQAAKQITDLLATISSTRSIELELLAEYRNCVTLAYVAALNGDLAEVIKYLKKVVNT